MGLAGDFCLTMEYTDLTTKSSQQEWGTGLEFKVWIGPAETGLQARDWHGQHGQRGWRAVWQQNTPLGDRDYDDETRPNFPAAGRLRLVRLGPNLYYLLAEPGSAKFQVISQRPIGTAEIRSVLIEAVAADQVSGTDFVVKNLTIQAEKFVDPESSQQN